jgi:hypothetical protein
MSDEDFVDSLSDAEESSVSLRGSSPFAIGTCYAFSNCSGLSTHVFSKSNCPPGTRSFKADYENFGCELVW